MKREPKKIEEAGDVLLQEINEPGEDQTTHKRSVWNVIAIPLLAILTGLVIGAILIAATSTTVYAAFGESIGQGLSTAWNEVITAYQALFTGSIGDPARIISALRSGDDRAIRSAFNPFLESLVQATPYIFAGLAVALGFRSGLFNIGVEGQLFVGAACATFVGYAITGLPTIIHMPLAFLAGALGGAIWGFIPGLLKATTGGHEVINTIMMNYIAFRLAEYLLDVGGPMARGDGRPVSPEIQPSAYLPQLFPNRIEMRLNAGFLLALAVAFGVWWLLYKTTLGYEIRTVGQNPHAARYAGIHVARTMVLTMGLSGALAGLSATTDILGVLRFMPNAFFSGYGFDAIALALLGKSHPLGVVLASLLFGALRAGAQNMQGIARVPVDLTAIIQGLIIVFIAAPEIIRSIYRLRQPLEGEELVVAHGWGEL